MRGNSHVRFLGDRVGVILPGYPTGPAPFQSDASEEAGEERHVETACQYVELMITLA
jgi:hypothetical protein